MTSSVFRREKERDVNTGGVMFYHVVSVISPVVSGIFIGDVSKYSILCIKYILLLFTALNNSQLETCVVF